MTKRCEQVVLTVGQVAERINAKLIGDGTKRLTGANSIEEASESQISFITSDRHAQKVAGSKAAAVIVRRKIDKPGTAQLIVDNVQKALIAALNLFAPKLTPSGGIHQTAVVEDTAHISENASIGAGAYISHNARIGCGSIISAGCVIGENTIIGDNCRLDYNVAVYHNCKIGNNCIIQANTAIGSTGFGYYFIDGEHKLIPHNGEVVIEDCVEIGANCCVDRAKFGSTIIGAGTKIDNLVQVAHNVVTGKCCLIAALVGIAGSCRLGDGVVLGGQAGLAEHVNLGDGVMLGGRSGMLEDVAPGQHLLGMPAIDAKKQLRVWALIRRLPGMAKQLKEVIRKVDDLEAAKNDKR